MKYTKTELKNMIDSSYGKDSKAKAAAGLYDSPEEFRITNLTANIRVIADLLCRMQDQLNICKEVYNDVEGVDIYKQAWRGMVDTMEWELEYWDRRVDEVIEGGE